MLCGQVRFRLERVAQECGQPVAGSLDGLIQYIGSGHPENLLCRGVKPANDRILIGGDDAGRNRFEQSLRERFLKCDLFVKKRVFEHGGDVLGKHHQVLQIAVLEALARETMTEKDPADDAPAGVQRHNDFSAEGVEGAAHGSALRLVGHFGQIAARN